MFVATRIHAQEYFEKLTASVSVKEAPPFCISPKLAKSAAASFFGIPESDFGVDEDVVFWGFGNIMYDVAKRPLESTGFLPSILVNSRTNRVAEVELYPSHWEKGDVKVEVAFAREAALRFASAHYHKHRLVGMKLFTDGVPCSFEQAKPYRFEWGDTDPIYRNEPLHYCCVDVSCETGDVRRFRQDADDFEPKISFRPKITKEQAIEVAKRSLAIVDLSERQTRDHCFIKEDDVEEQYLQYEVEVHGTNPNLLIPHDGRPKSFGGLVGIDATTGEVLSCMGGSWRPRESMPDSFWPEDRGIKVKYFSRLLKLYQPPIRKDGKLYLNKGFFPPFLVDVDEDIKNGKIVLRSRKGKRELKMGQGALLVKGRLLILARHLVDLSPEAVIVDETEPANISISWDYEHRRTPFPAPGH